ncbi:transposase [Thiohalocapsa marina]|uniref:Transposase n=1 Tax=Thiohalocapsa marina TaxID=424902 RepID=A0A5M8FPV3_9GAMM|nr:transposase [Thiohalocapsa marina]KAA6186928.1 transposase [Thiohalocapsa marina]
MARLPRFRLPDYPQHVIHRGSDHLAILRDEEDYWVLWGVLHDACDRFACEIHAYVLMPNHFHLLLTPRREDGVGKLMQCAGRQYVHHFNQRYGRSGTLWEGRYRATVLDPDAYLLAACRYIELNPVRAGLVAGPDEYDWSSHAANALGNEDELVQPHAVYRQLGRSAKARRDAYRTGFGTPLSADFIKRLRDATNKAWVLGDAAFCHDIEARLNRRALPRERGGDRRSAAYRRAAATGAAAATGHR